MARSGDVEDTLGVINTCTSQNVSPPESEGMSKAVTEEYAELTHYTTGAGLAGIVSSGCLWASHAAFLNDSEEMRHFFDARLPDLALPEVLTYASELARLPANAKKMEADGGIEKLARLEAEKTAKNLRTVTLAFNHPYIFSMSGTRDPLVAHSGLLSQWRGYGSDGGYALVFDTVEFDRLLKLEGETYHYQHALWGDVHYYGVAPSSQPSSEEVAESEAVVSKGIARLVRGGTAEETQGFYEAISSLSCLYKHWGFWEEHEIRVIAIPVDTEVAQLVAAEGQTKLQKPIKTFLRGGLPVPYLELFNQPVAAHGRVRLPIKRVIVGPHREAAIRAQAVQRLLAANDYEAEVVCSQIPYIGR